MKKNNISQIKINKKNYIFQNTKKNRSIFNLKILLQQKSFG